MYAGKSLKKAREQAQANANYFGVVYQLFFDTNGNIIIERLDRKLQENAELFLPRVQSKNVNLPFLT